VLERLTVDDFAPRVGERFTAHLPSGATLSLLLAAATRLGQGRPGASRAPFSLHFTGPVEPFLPQSTYALDLSQDARVDLFLVPIAEEPGGFRYEAIFT
jgi:hypothetical protein